MSMRKTTFEWDEEKDRENQEKHKVSFIKAQQAFLDPQRVIVEDMAHSSEEESTLLHRTALVMVL